MAVDDSYTKVLLHANGSDASTTFTDESGKTWTANGNAQLDTAQKKFGTASGYFPAADTDYISTPDSADFTLGTSDFTIDFNLRLGSNVSVNFYDQYQDANNENVCYYSSVASKIYFYAWISGAYVFRVECAFSPSTNTWYHIELGRGSGTFYIFIDGTRQSVTVTSGTVSSSIANITGSPKIGGLFSQTAWIDEYRFSLGIIRHIISFIPKNFEYGSSVKKICGVDLANIKKINLVNVYTRPTEFFSNPLYSDANLQAYWKLEGNSLDETAGNHDGTDTNITYGTSAGRFNKGAYFLDTSTSKISIPAFLSASAGSISFWVNTIASTATRRLITDADGYIYFEFSSTNNLRFVTYDTGVKATAAGTLNSGSWYHVVGVWGDSGNARLYINGSLIGSVAVGNLGSVSSAFLMGGTTGVYCNCSLDDVAVFDRVLTSTEVSSLYTTLNYIVCDVKKIGGVTVSTY